MTGMDAVTPAVVDQLLGTVAATADDAFNPILELGFATSIARRGQSPRASTQRLT